MDIEIIFENENILLLNKPYGLQVEPDRFNYPNLLDWAHQKNNLHKDKTYYLVNRLDRPTSGLVILAKNKSTYKFLQKEWSKDYVTKKYYAIVQGQLIIKASTLTHFLEKNHNLHKALVLDNESIYTKKSTLTYNVINEDKEYSLLDIQLLTGRYHQIRAQCSYICHAVWNDTLYGAPKVSDEICIGLHCYYTSIKLDSNSNISEYFCKPHNHPAFNMFQL